ncbi:MAG: CopG family transcriptional regulator [Candidatus Omnitrophota bacterium]|nr:CopG family transcriptional regulator [Candidatus Omnitrophota bacterium]
MPQKKSSDSDMPIGRLTRVDNFLPPPQDLVLPEKTVKVTLALTKASVEFFKKQAHRHHIKYQKMIRELVDRYAKMY